MFACEATSRCHGHHGVGWLGGWGQGLENQWEGDDIELRLNAAFAETEQKVQCIPMQAPPEKGNDHLAPAMAGDRPLINSKISYASTQTFYLTWT